MARSQKNKMKRAIRLSGPGSVSSKKGIRKSYKKAYKSGRIKSK